MSANQRCTLGCVGVFTCTYLREPSLFSNRPSYLPAASKFCGSSCSCEKDFSSKVKNEVLSLITVNGRQRDPAFSNSVQHPTVEEMIQCATMCYWALRFDQLGLVPDHDDTRLLPPCFHRTLRGITAIASQMRLVEDKEIKSMLNEVDRQEKEEEEEKFIVWKEWMRHNY